MELNVQFSNYNQKSVLTVKTNGWKTQTQRFVIIILSHLLAISSATSSSIHTSVAYSRLCHVSKGLWLIPALREESVSADKMRASLRRRAKKKKEELLKGPEGEIQNKKTLKKLREDREGKLGV